ncbi:MAG: UDP-N-acetylmuramate dehydrogenase [Armatimonadota bacterium]
MPEIDIISARPDICRCNVHLAPYTTWRIGGPAEIFIEPHCPEDIILAFNYAEEHGMPVNVIGHGSNILIDDAGIPGVVIHTCASMNDISIDEDAGIIRTAAGCMLPKLSTSACKHGISGYEFLAGIPGTVGGGIVTNAGTGGQSGPSIKDHLLQVTVLDKKTGAVYRLSLSDLELGYRHSNILERKLLILEADFRIADKVSPDLLMNLVKEILGERKTAQPDESYTAGSIFKRPSIDKSAGWYIEQAGLKSFRIGGAFVSPKHANWIINDGTASSSDIWQLTEHIRSAVSIEFGISLEYEISFLPGNSVLG